MGKGRQASWTGPAAERAKCREKGGRSRRNLFFFILENHFEFPFPKDFEFLFKFGKNHSSHKKVCNNMSA
jgi:hypothetical protein